jgi:hypothetical protein
MSKVASVFINGLMAGNTKACGSMENNMEKVALQITKTKLKKEFGITASELNGLKQIKILVKLLLLIKAE